MQTALQKLNKKFTDCKNHRDFYMYFKEHKDELMDDERMQIINTGNAFVLQDRWRNGEHYFNETYNDGK